MNYVLAEVTFLQSNPQWSKRVLVSWQNGGGVQVDEGGDATLMDSNVYQNEALDRGGGLYIQGTAALTNVNVYANRAEVCLLF